MFKLKAEFVHEINFKRQFLRRGKRGQLLTLVTMRSKIIPTNMRQPLKMKQPQTGNTNDKNVHARQRRVAPLK